MSRLRPLGILAMIVVVVALVSIVKEGYKPNKIQQGKQIVWEDLNSEYGPEELKRTRTPSGWMIYDPEMGYYNVIDPEHKWLNDE